MLQHQLTPRFVRHATTAMPKGEAGTVTPHHTLGIGSCSLPVFVPPPAAVLERNLPAMCQCHRSRPPPEKGRSTKCYRPLHRSPQQVMFRNGMHRHLTLPCSGIQLGAERGLTPPAHLCPCFSYSLC